MVYSVGLLVFFMLSDFEKPLSHFEQLKVFSSVWVLSCSFKELDLEKHLPRFVHLNGFSPVSLSNLMVRSSCHTLGTWMESLLSGFPYVPSSGQLLRSCWHTLGIKKASLLCGSSHVSSSCMLEGMPYYNWSIWIGFLLFGSSHESKWPNFEKFLVHVLHLNVFFSDWRLILNAFLLTVRSIL